MEGSTEEGGGAGIVVEGGGAGSGDGDGGGGDGDGGGGDGDGGGGDGDGGGGEGEGGGGEGEGGGGGGAGVVEAMATMGVLSTVMPSLSLAAAAVPRLVESEVSTAEAVVECGTAMVAVMSTEPATTLMATADGSTPASSATELWRADVSP